LALVATQDVAGLGFEREQLIAGCRDEHDAVIDNRGRLVALDLAGGIAPDRLQPADVGRRDLAEGAVAPAIVRAPVQEPVAVLGLLEPLGGDRRVVLQDFRDRPRHRSGRSRCDGLLRKRSRDAGGQTDRSHAATLRHCPESGHESPPLFHCETRVSYLAPDRFGTQVGAMPTRPVKVFATASLPSTSLSGSAGNARGAGPSMTVAP